MGKLVLVCVLFAASGCQTARYVRQPLVDDRETADALHQAMESRYPGSFEAVHRSILTVRNRQFNLDGYVSIDNENGHHLLVTTGLGNAIFEIFWPIDGTIEIVRNNGLLDDQMLTDGPGLDVLRMYRLSPSSSAILIAPTPDTLVFEDKLNDATVAQYLIDRATDNLLRYQLTYNGRVRYRIEYGDYSDASLEGYSIPRKIVIDNKKSGYTIDIRLIEMKANQPVPAHEPRN